MKNLIGKDIRLIVGGLTLLTGAITVSAQTLVTQTLINDTDYTGATKLGNTITLSSGKTYTNINTSGDASGMTVSGSTLNLSTSGNSTMYRGFDDGFSIKLNQLQIGESLSLSFNASAPGLSLNALLSFGFTSLSTNTNPAYVVDNIGGGYAQTAFYYRNDKALMTDYGAVVGAPINSGNVLIDGLSHNFTFTITAAGSGQYTLSAMMDTSTVIIPTATVTWNAAMADTLISGVSFRESQGSTVAFDNLNVLSYFAVPEPTTLFLIGAGVGLLVLVRCRKRGTDVRAA